MEGGLAAEDSGGAIECLSGAGLFICRTEPGAPVTIGQEGDSGGEVYPNRTGMFGVALHAGGFELKRTADAAATEHVRVTELPVKTGLVGLFRRVRPIPASRQQAPGE